MKLRKPAWTRRPRASQFESLEARLPMAGDIAGAYGQKAEVFDLFTLYTT